MKKKIICNSNIAKLKAKQKLFAHKKMETSQVTQTNSGLYVVDWSNLAKQSGTIGWKATFGFAPFKTSWTLVADPTEEHDIDKFDYLLED